MNTAHLEQRTSACRRCGECCRIRGFVRLSADEVDRIAEFLGLSPRPFANRYTRLAHDRCGLELEEKENGECIFLEGAECAIHAVKPIQCRTFPDGWRYPGVEEICPAWRQEIPNSPPKADPPLADKSQSWRKNNMKVSVKKPTQEELGSLGVEKWGTWECDPSTFDWSYDSPETCYILEGKAQVQTPEGMVEFGKGDLVRFPEGLNCTWTVVEKVRKKYSFQ